jgi:hypothetical protein
MIQLGGPYQTRPIRCQEIWEHDGWRLKVYGISALGDEPPAQLVAAIKFVAASTLPPQAVTDERYGIGFLYAHEFRNGAGGASVNWWVNENELHHHQYEAPPGSLSDLEPVEVSGRPTGCIWDLAVIAFERDAWIETVLANESGPDLDAYLAREMNEDV